MMPAANRLWCCFKLLTCAAAAHAAPSSPEPIQLFRTQSFNDAGFLTARAVGTEARVFSQNLVQIKGLNLALFRGDGSTQPETNLLAPFAELHSSENKLSANGDQGVRVIRADLEASGQIWSYDHSEKRLLMQNDVRVIFHAELKNVLK